MKKILFIIAVAIVTVLKSFSQNLNSDINPLHEFPVSRQQLIEATTLIDIKTGYAKNWVTEYISTEVSASSKGKIIKAFGKNDTLTEEQKRVFSMADLGWDVKFQVKYKLPNPVTGKLEISTMNFFVTMATDSNIYLPVVNAEYMEGKEVMRKYLFDNIVQPVTKITPEKYQKGRLKFTVTEAGEIINCVVTESSGDAKTDTFLVESIRKLKYWKPARNVQGNKVSQDFQFTLGVGGC